MDSIASSIATGSYWPRPNSSALSNNFASASSAAAHSNEYSIRMDYNFSQNDRIWGRWSQKYEQKINFPTYYGASDPGGPGVVAPNNRYSANVGYSHIFSPTFALSANLGVNRHVEQSTTQSFGFESSTLGLPSFPDGIAPSFLNSSRKVIRLSAHKPDWTTTSCRKLCGPVRSISQRSTGSTSWALASWISGRELMAGTLPIRPCSFRPPRLPVPIRRMPLQEPVTASLHS
jgi:hypothetical protein